MKNDVKQDVPEIGRKFDVGKNKYGLLPPISLDEVVKVLTFGSQKYSENNWMYVEDGENRYFDAAQRHMWAWKRGELTDSETGLSHLAHAVCCLMFLNELPYVKNKI
jgi:hypothetical protein